MLMFPTQQSAPRVQGSRHIHLCIPPLGQFSAVGNRVCLIDIWTMMTFNYLMRLEVGRAIISGLQVGVSDSLAFPPQDCKVAAIAKSLVSLYSQIHIQGNETQYLFSFIREENLSPKPLVDRPLALISNWPQLSYMCILDQGLALPPQCQEISAQYLTTFRILLTGKSPLTRVQSERYLGWDPATPARCFDRIWGTD